MGKGRRSDRGRWTWREARIPLQLEQRDEKVFTVFAAANYARDLLAAAVRGLVLLMASDDEDEDEDVEGCAAAAAAVTRVCVAMDSAAALGYSRLNRCAKVEVSRRQRQ